jgi:hypothetical protein
LTRGRVGDSASRGRSAPTSSSPWSKRSRTSATRDRLPFICRGSPEATTDAAQLLKGWLDALWNGGEGKRIVYLYVVPGNVARVLVAAGFRERDDWHELIYTMPRSADASALW